MENVSGMIKGTMKGKFNEILGVLKALDYNVKVKLMNAMWYEVPQSRERLFFIGVRKDLNIEPSFPKPMEKVITIREAFIGIENEYDKQPNGKYLEIAKAIKQGTSNGGGKYSIKLNGSINGFGMSRLAWDKPSPTITKLSLLSSCLLHPEMDARITIKQAKRICSFPDEYKLNGNFNELWARLGNAVMPKMMYHIAKNIRENILSLTNQIN